MPPSLRELRDGWDRHLVQAKADAVRSNNIDRQLLSGSRAAVESSLDLLQLIDHWVRHSGQKTTD